MENVSVYFRSTFRNRFDYGATLFEDSVDCEDNCKGKELDLLPDDEDCTEEQQAYGMVERSFGEDAAALFSTCTKPEDKQLADDTHRPCLYTLPSDGQGRKYGIETVVQYRLPQPDATMDTWADCSIEGTKVLRITYEEEDYIVARMTPSDYSDAIAFHSIYLILPVDCAAKSLRKRATLPEPFLGKSAWQLKHD